MVESTNHPCINTNTNENKLEEVQAIQELVTNLKQILLHSTKSSKSKTPPQTNTRWVQYYTKYVVSDIPKQVQQREKVQSIQMKTKQRQKVRIFQNWVFLALNRIEEKKYIRTIVNRRYMEYIQSWQSIIMQKWLMIATGSSSKKQILFKRRKRMDVARISLHNKMNRNDRFKHHSRLSEQNIHGIIPKELVEMEMYKMEIFRMKQRRIFVCKQKFFTIWMKINQTMKDLYQYASIQHQQNVLKTIIKSWHKWSFHASIGVDRPVWQNKPITIRVTRYNQVRVDAFANRRVIQLFFFKWRQYAKTHWNVKQWRIRKWTVFVRTYFLEWLRVSRRNRNLLQRALKTWNHYGYQMKKEIFEAWHQYLLWKIQNRNIQCRLVTSYTRCKSRKTLWNIFRKWRHQAVYGRVNAFYSRSQLMMTLVEQTKHCRNMEYKMNQCMDHVSLMAECLQKNKTLVEHMNEEMLKKDKDIKAFQLSIHSAEQELLRLNSIIDTFNIVHPELMKHIMTMQSKFGFKDRKLNTFIEMRRMKQRSDTGVTNILLEILHKMEWILKQSQLGDSNTLSIIKRQSSNQIKNKKDNYDELTQIIMSSKDKIIKFLLNLIQTGDKINTAPKDYINQEHQPSQNGNDNALNYNIINSDCQRNTDHDYRQSLHKPSLKWDDFNLLLNPKMPLPKGQQNISLEKKIELYYYQRLENSLRDKESNVKPNIYLAIGRQLSVSKQPKQEAQKSITKVRHTSHNINVENE